MLQLGNTLFPLTLPVKFVLQASYVRSQHTLQQSVLSVGQMSPFVPLEQLSNKLLLIVIQFCRFFALKNCASHCLILIQLPIKRAFPLNIVFFGRWRSKCLQSVCIGGILLGVIIDGLWVVVVWGSWWADHISVLQFKEKTIVLREEHIFHELVVFDHFKQIDNIQVSR